MLLIPRNSDETRLNGKKAQTTRTGKETWTPLITMSISMAVHDTSSIRSRSWHHFIGQNALLARSPFNLRQELRRAKAMDGSYANSVANPPGECGENAHCMDP